MDSIVNRIGLKIKAIGNGKWTSHKMASVSCGTCRITVLRCGKKESEGKFERLEEPSPLEGSLGLS